jgi:hypothetical protein
MRRGAPAAWGLAMGLLLGAAAAGKDGTRITITSGTPQTARAWVAARANRYEAKFDGALVVQVSPAKTKVRFRCVTSGCEFPASDQPDTVTRVDPNAYDVAAVKGRASIRLTVWTVTPENVVVVAQPADAAGPQVRFVLNEQ